MSELVDQSIIGELQDIMGDEMDILVSTFIHDSREKFKQLASAIGAGDWETTYRTAHSIKGSSRNLGATQLATCLEKLEKDARAQQTDELDSLLVIASGLFENTCEILNQH